MHWHLWLDPLPRPGFANMAIDQALLDRSDRWGERWLRCYQWAPHCLSFGRHEPAARRYDAGRIAALGLDVVRRPTGGRAVWHGWELTYAVTAPGGELGGLREAYLGIHRVLLAALQYLGAAAELAPDGRAAGVDAGACFSRPAGGEIMARAGKLVGSAQLRQGAAFLQHGSILLDGDQTIVGAVTRRRAPPDQATSLSAVLGRSVPPADLAAAISKAAMARWGGTWERTDRPDAVLESAQAHRARFQSAEWTWVG